VTNFGKRLETVKNFVEKNYPEYLERYGIPEPFVTTEFVDFDRFKNDFVLFLEFDTINFNPGPYADDCGDVLRLAANILLAFRNDTVANLDRKLMDASTAMHGMLRAEKLHKENPDMADNLTVRTLDFFKYVEGNKNLVAARFALEFEIAC